MNPINKDKRMFKEREELTPRTPMEDERMLFAMIESGDIEAIHHLINKSKFRAGKMSSNSLRQSKYMAVSFIALGTRTAISAGMLETDAFNLSDHYIQEVDKLTTSDEILSMIFEIMKILTQSVRDAKTNQAYSNYVKDTIDYIFKNLHFKVTLIDLSNHLGISREHLSRLFKKETGQTISSYILEERLKLSKSLLQIGDLDSKQIAYNLDFCSQSHFISCFKKQYGMTPNAFKKGSIK